MKDIEIIKYKQSPIPIPNPDEAWEDMRRRLPQATTQTVVPADSVIPTDSAKPSQTLHTSKDNFARITGTTLLLLFAALWPITLLTPTARTPRTLLTSRTLPTPHAAVAGTATPSTTPSTIPSTTLQSQNLIMANSPQLPKHYPSPPHTRATPQPSSRQSRAQTSVDNPDSAPQQPTTPTTIIASHHPATEPPHPDSAAETPVNLAQPERILFQAGLQWTAQIPTGNTGAYLAGTNGHTHIYRPILPAAWMHLQFAKSLFELGFDPFFSDLVPSHPYSHDNNTATRSDTTVTTSQTRTLRKLFGIAAKAGYATALGSHWWAGGGIETIFWTHAIALNHTQEIQQPLNNPGAGISHTFNSTTALSKTEWHDNFSNFQLNVYGQLLYNTTTWHAGFRAGFPFTVVARNQGPSSPLRLELFYRLPLLTRQIHASTSNQQSAN